MGAKVLTIDSFEDIVVQESLKSSVYDTVATFKPFDYSISTIEYHEKKVDLTVSTSEQESKSGFSSFPEETNLRQKQVNLIADYKMYSKRMRK